MLLLTIEVCYSLCVYDSKMSANLQFGLMQDTPDTPNVHPCQQIHQQGNKFAVDIRRSNRKLIFQKKRQCFEDDLQQHQEIHPLPPPSPPNAGSYLPPPRQRPPSPPHNTDPSFTPHKFGEDNLLYRAHRFDLYKPHSPFVPPQPITPGMRLKPRECSLQQRAIKLYSSKEPFSREFAPTRPRTPAVLDQDLGDFIQEVIDRRYTIEDFPRAIEDFQSGEDLSVIQGAIVIRRLVSKFGQVQTELVDRLMREGLLLVFMRMVKEGKSMQLKHEAAWIISNIASIDQYCQLVVAEGGIQAAFGLLMEGEEALVLAGLWLMGNISADGGNRFQQGILAMDGMRTIIGIAEATSKKYIFSACIWVVINLLGGDSELFVSEITDGINFLCQALELGFIEHTQDDFSEGLSVLFLKMSTHQQVIASTGIIPFLIHLCRGVLPLALDTYDIIFKILVVFSQGDETLAQMMLVSGILEVILLWLERGSDLMREELLVILSNLAAYSTDNAERVMAHPGLLQAVVRLVFESSQIQQEVCIVLINVSLYGTSKSLFECYRRIQIIQKLFCAFKDLNYSNTTLINTFLELIQRVLQCGQLPQHLVKGNNVFCLEMEDSSINRLSWTHQIDVVRNHNDELVHKRATFIDMQFFNRQRDQQQNEEGEGDEEEVEEGEGEVVYTPTVHRDGGWDYFGNNSDYFDRQV